MDDARKARLTNHCRGVVNANWPGLSTGQMQKMVDRFLKTWEQFPAESFPVAGEGEGMLTHFVIENPEVIRPVPDAQRVKSYMLAHVLNSEEKMRIGREIDNMSADQRLAALPVDVDKNLSNLSPGARAAAAERESERNGGPTLTPTEKRDAELVRRGIDVSKLSAIKRLEIHRLLEAQGLPPRLSDAQQAQALGKELSPGQRILAFRQSQAAAKGE